MEKKSLVIDFNEKNFTKRVVFNEGTSTVFVLNFLPGQQLPLHQHPGTDVILLVLEGKGTVLADGKPTELMKNDVIYCSGDQTFGFQNTSDGKTSCYVMLNRTHDDRFAKDI